MKFFFVKRSLDEIARELITGLKNLSFEDNFSGFLWTGTIAASSETSIRNKFRDGAIPSGFVIVDASECNNVVRGDAEWTETALSLKNFDSTLNATVTVFFYR